MSKKTTKRALAMSFVSVFLCVCMLVGTTFAWFTDSVTSGNNVIKSGTLDVTMEWADGTKAVPAADSTDWKDASKGAIFNNDLWEPGYTEVRHIKIGNKGTLALKYQLSITPDGETSKLTDVIDVYYFDGAKQITSRTELTDANKIGTLTDALAGMANTAYGELPAGESHTVTIALKMQEDATNEYQGLSIGSDFSVVLMATQDNVEKDAFDENYDDIDVPDKHIKVIDGNTYYYLNDGNVVLRSVPYGNLGSSFTVRNDVTLLGIGVDKGDTNGPVFSKSSSVETLTLNEGLVKINARAVTGVKTLTSVNFPSTLKFIGEQAFAQAGMTSLTIPANVEEIKLGAFRDMAKLTTVTVEGNVAFDDYAFRSCPNLTSIYLLGDDVTFNGGQFATHSDNGNATGITIYVKNATVAARVYAAQTSAYGYKVKVLGTAADGSDAQEVVVKATNNAQLNEAIQAGAKAVVLAEGDYALRFTNNTNFNLNDMTIMGLGNVNLAISSSEAWYGRVQGSNVTFENIHFTSSVGATGKATYNNCTFDSWAICASSNNEETTFNNCTIKGCLNTSTDFSSGDVSVNNCQIAKAEYSGSMTMNFVDCQIGEIIIWNADTNLTNCQVTTLDTSHVTNATVTIK